MTTNFTLEELYRSSFAIRNNIDNTPNEKQTENLRFVANNLEYLRKKLGNYPILVTSGFRNKEVNKAVGGVRNSDHLEGLAVDIIVKNNKSIKDTAKQIIETQLEFDQIIIYRNFIHLGFNKRMRRNIVWYY